MRSWLPRRALTILAVVTALLAAGLHAEAAEDPLTVTAPVTDALVSPGEDAVFAFSIGNNRSTLAASVTIALLNGTGAWPASASPNGTVEVPAGGARNGTVTVRVPADAAPDTTYPYLLRVTDHSNPLEERTYTLGFNVTTEGSRTHGSGGPSLTLTPANPAVEAAPGEVVNRTAELALEGKDRLNVVLSADAPTGWGASATPSNAVLLAGWPRAVTLSFTVPADAEVNATHLLVLRASADDGSAEAVTTWTVTVVPPPPAPEPAEEEGATNASTTTTGASEDADAGGNDAPTATATGEEEPAPQPEELLTLVLEDPALHILPGDHVRSALTLTNPAASPRVVTLTAPVQDGWVITFEGGSIVTVPAGASRTVNFSATAPADAEPSHSTTYLVHAEEAVGELTLTVDAPAPVTQAREETPEGLATQDAPGNAPIDAVIARYGAGPVLAAAGAVTALGGAVWLRGAPHVRRNLWWIGIGAYTRLTRPKLLEHEERQRLYAAIQDNPGIHFHALQRELGWNTGALTYHLRVLERHQMVTSRRDGIMRRFYLVGTAPREMPKAVSATGKAVTLTGIRGSVMTIVNDRGRVPQAQLVDELGTSKQSINYHVKNLERLGLLRVERVGRETFLTPAEDVELTGLEHAGAVAPNADATAARPGLAVAGGDER